MSPITTGKIVRALICLKIIYIGCIYLALRMFPDLDLISYYSVMRQWPMDGDPEFCSHFATWDAAHYLYLTVEGYNAGENSCAFYPLWPLLIKVLSACLNNNSLLAGLLLANILSVFGWALFFDTTQRRFGTAVAVNALILWIVFPGSLFFQFVYAESLFLFLVMLLWFGIDRSHYGAATLAAFLLPMTRGNGVFCILPIIWAIVVYPKLVAVKKLNQAEAMDQDDSNASPISKCYRYRWYVLAATPIVGWFCYLLIMWHFTRNPFEGFHAQRFWGNVHSVGNLFNVPKFITSFFLPTSWHGFTGSLLDRVGFLLLAITLPIIWRLGKDLVIWVYVLGIIPAMSGTFTSYIRYEALAFPVFIGLGLYFTKRTSKSPLKVYLVICLTAHIILLWRFVNFRWVG